MSKDFAQTVSGPKIAWLLAIVAAFAVLATLGTQWQKSEAAFPVVSATVTLDDTTPAPGQTVTYTVAFTVTGTSPAVAIADILELQFDPALIFDSETAADIFGTGSGATCAVDLANELTCDGLAVGNYASGSITVDFIWPFNGEAVARPTGNKTNGACAIDVTAVTCDASAIPATITADSAVTVDELESTNALGLEHTFTFTFPVGYTCASDADPATVECTVADVNLTGDLVLVSGPTTSGRDVSVSVVGTVGGTVSLDATFDDGNGGIDFTSQAGTKNYVEVELFHVDDFGYFIHEQEVANNVRGSRHTACVGYRTLDGDENPIIVGANIGTNFNYFFGVLSAGDAYSGPENPVNQQATANDVSRFIGETFSTFDQEVGDSASCLSWYSVGAGDQSVYLTYTGDDAQGYDVRWDNDGLGQRALVKEWNVLEDSTVSAVIWTPAGSQTAQTSTHDLTSAAVNGSAPVGSPLTITIPLTPALNGGYTFNGAVIITDIFNGSHINAGAQIERFGAPGLAGVAWDFTKTGCGTVLEDNGPNVTKLAALFDTDEPGDPYDGFTVVDNPRIVIGNFGNCDLSSQIVVTIVGTEGDLLSGDGLLVTQQVVINFTVPPVAQKQVFLAWAGQRIILEHDWRVPAGDRTNTSPGTNYPLPAVGSTCIFGTQSVQAIYLKGSGPGNFLPGLGATLSGSDEARVQVGGATQQNPNPNDHCISRVLFESEDQGQVDIEAFLNTGGNVNVTKHAFVIYYMKINTVTTSLVTQAAKPNHNGAGDWAAIGTTNSANPWNSSLDDADGAVEWNVSRDILARVRVTGWFLTTNPSGRPADTSNPLNVLPANRWVMPDDWAQLHGGPIDAAGLNETTHNIGTAEEFRSYYDLMFAPNNAAGIALGNPEGLGTGSVLATAQAGSGTGSGTSTPPSPIIVNSCALLPVGTLLTTYGAVASCANNLLFVTVPTATQAGTFIRAAAGVPFEGPYSLIDIPGLAAQGRGGAALSNFLAVAPANIGNIRDTILGDGDVDAWDAPMPPAMVSIKLRGTGFLKPVLKQDVYYNGSANSTTQTYPNPYYIQNIPGSPWIPAVEVGGGYLWNSWGNDGPGGNGDGVYRFWTWIPNYVGKNSAGIGEALSATDLAELAIISAAGHGTVARDAVVYTDNHGEAMFAANGDFKTDLTACTTNALAGGKHCKPGDKVGTGTITATADYPDFRGKHFPVLSNAVTVDWLWGGYKDVTVHPGETDQFKYVVFHAMDRDGFCSASGGQILLHSVLNAATVPASYTGMTDNSTDFSGLGARYNFDPHEKVDFLIDSGEGIIIGTSAGNQAGSGHFINDGRQFASGVPTYSVSLNNPATSGVLEFPLSPLAADGQTDECQAWIKISNSLLGIVNVLTIAHDDEGQIGFDRVIDLTNTTSYTLNFRWSLITWAGANGIPVSDALTGTGSGGQNPGGNDISASVTAIYGWNAAAQQWLAYFPSGVNVPGANDLTALNTGQAYWIAITGPSSVTWTVASNVN